MGSFSVKLYSVNLYMTTAVFGQLEIIDVIDNERK